MIPERLMEFRQACPVLEEIIEWQLLRKWSLSEVYRAKLQTGEQLIVKWGGNDMASEAKIYHDLLIALQIKCPQIYEYHEDEQCSLLLMEDAGQYNLEQKPKEQHFLEAAKELARFRRTAAKHLQLSCIPKITIKAYTVSKHEFLSQLNDLIQAKDHLIFHRVKQLIPIHLERIYKEVPLTLVHHDYHAKNLLIQRNHILPIDWAIAYLSPHLGDLFCLIQEAHSWCGLDKETIFNAFHQEVGNNALSLDELKHQVNVGGLCWLIRSLRWLIYGGTKTIPGSEEWIPDLMADMHLLLTSVEEE